jgi:hypothetical protein
VRCLIVEVCGAQAAIMCNECGAIIRTEPVEEVESAMAKLAETDTICSARCTHCGALSTFPGWTSMSAFTCSECGEGVQVIEPAQ